VRRGLLIALLVAGIACGGVGTALVAGAAPPASAGWIAYAPLSHQTFTPGDPAWLLWRPRVGSGLLAVGAGASGAALAALVLLERPGRGGRA